MSLHHWDDDSTVKDSTFYTRKWIEIIYLPLGKYWILCNICASFISLKGAEIFFLNVFLNVLNAVRKK